MKPGHKLRLLEFSPQRTLLCALCGETMVFGLQAKPALDTVLLKPCNNNQEIGKFVLTL